DIMGEYCLSISSGSRFGAVFRLPCAGHICFPAATLTNSHIGSARKPRYMLQDRFSSFLITVWTYPMRWFGGLHAFLHGKGKDPARPQFFQFVALLLCFPCFKASHFCFKRVYAINQLRLRRLGGENLFLEFYDRPVANGG